MSSGTWKGRIFLRIPDNLTLKYASGLSGCCAYAHSAADICSWLRDVRFANELHPMDESARMIAEEVYGVLAAAYKPAKESSR